MAERDDQFKTLLNCGICSEPFSKKNIDRQPLLLYCAHSFCFSCLTFFLETKTFEKKLVLEEKKLLELLCPLCREPSPLEEDQDLPFRKNYALLELLEAIEQEEKEDHRTCNNCEEVTPSSFCSACQAALCDTCDDAIHKHKALQKHTRVPFAKAEMDYPALLPLCKVHGKPLGFYSLENETLVCRDCLDFGDHKGQTSKPIKDVEDQVKKELKEKAENLKILKEKLADSSFNLCHSLDKIKKQSEEAKGTICLSFEKLVAALIRRRDELLDSLEQEEFEVMNKLNQVREVISQNRAKADMLYGEVLRLLNTAGTKALRLKKSLFLECNRVLEKVNFVPYFNIGKSLFHVSLSVSQLEQAISRFGSIGPYSGSSFDSNFLPNVNVTSNTHAEGSDPLTNEELTVQLSEEPVTNLTQDPFTNQSQDPVTNLREEPAILHNNESLIGPNDALAVQLSEQPAINKEKEEFVDNLREEHVTESNEESALLHEEKLPSSYDVESVINPNQELTVQTNNESDSKPSSEHTVQLSEAIGTKTNEEPFVNLIDGSVAQQNEPVTKQNEKPATQLIEEFVTNRSEEPVIKSSEESVINTNEEPASKSSEESASKSSEEPASKSSEEPVIKSSEESVTKSNEEPAPQPTEEPGSKSTEEIATKSSEEPGTKSTEEPAPQPTEEPGTKSTEEPALQPTEEPGTKSTEEPAPQSTEEPGTKSTEELATKSSEEPGTKSTEEPATKSSEVPASQPKETLPVLTSDESAKTTEQSTTKLNEIDTPPSEEPALAKAIRQRNKYRMRARMLYDFEARSHSELTLKKGDIVFVHQKHSSGLWFGECMDGTTGHFPIDWCEQLPAEKLLKVDVKKRSNNILKMAHVLGLD